MQTLGNLVIGAILAGFSLGPVAWADTRMEVHHLVSSAAVIIAGKSVISSPLDHAVATARGAFSQLPNGERLGN
jgi:hypothetical protein